MNNHDSYRKSPAKRPALHAVLMLCIVAASSAIAQQATISMSSGSTTPGGSTTLNISLSTSGGAQPSDLQLTMNYPAADVTSVSVAAGAGATAASKSVSCSSNNGITICVVYGMNTSVIGNGVFATATFNIAAGAPDAAAAVQLTGLVASDPTGNGISTTGNGGTISITQTVNPTLTGLSCNPPSVTGPGSSACTVTLNTSAPTGGFTATLTSNNTAVTVPANVTVPGGSTSAGFTATVASVSTTQAATLTASAGGVSKTFLLSATPATWSISGTVSSAASGATVALSGAASATVTADSAGNYSFTGLANGSYTVTPSKSGIVFSPPSQTVTINGANQSAINFTASTGATNTITVDATVSLDQAPASSTLVSPTFSTISGNELLLAFVATDWAGATTTVTNVTGAGLTWTLVLRTDVQKGTAEIWRAFAPTALNNVTVTATVSPAAQSSMTVMSFRGADTSGTNGSGAIGATGTGNSVSGAPTASLVTTRNNSWVFGVGNDNTNAIARTPGAGQTVVHQYLAPIQDTFWVQMLNAPTPLAGTTVILNDTAPTSDKFNLSLVEILPALGAPPPPTWTISGSASSPGAGATVTLTGAASATVTADASGNYSFTGLPNGTYTVAPSKSGYSFSPASQTVTINGANVTAVNFTATLKTWSISGNTSSTGAGATVTLTGAGSATVTADASGNYSFTGLSNGTYTVAPSKSGYSFSPASQTVTINGANVTAVNFTATLKTWSISGNTSSTGAGATVTLSGAASATVTADASGNYSFTSLPNGTYTVAPSKSGYSFNPASQTVTINGANVTAVNFTATLQTWSISGNTSSTGAGATVTLSGAASATVTADASGNYSFTGLANGTYTVTPSKSGLTFSPANQSVSINNANVAGINFTAQTSTQTISVDAKVSQDQSTASSTIASPSFSTASGNELLLALIGSGYQHGKTNTTVTSVSGAGLTWVRVIKTNVLNGTAEIWRAFAPTALSNVSVTANFSQKVLSSITVMSFTGVDTSGTSGSGAIGAVRSAYSASGPPTATLTSTRANSLTVGSGDDLGSATARTPGAGQSLVHQYLAPNGDTYWVQMRNSVTPIAGSSVTINDTAPTSDPYNLSIVEILPAVTAQMTTLLTAPVAQESPGGSVALSNAASGAAGDACSSGGMATIFGTGLITGAAQQAASVPLPRQLAGLQVKINDVAAPLVFVSDSQVNFECPQLPAGSPLHIVLESENGNSSMESVMRTATPGLFTIDSTDQGAVLIGETNEIAMPKTDRFPSRPAQRGEYITIYATGLGEVEDGVPAGTPAPLDRTVQLRNQIKIVAGDLEIDPSFAGLVPGTVGLYQVNAQLPPEIAAGSAVPLSIKVILPNEASAMSNIVTVAID
jgi:uncharacterized protein (TIGR03437 family)